MQTQTRISVQSHKRGSLQRSLGLLVAVLIMMLLVGSLIAVFQIDQIAHQKPSGQTGASQQQGSKPGQVIYSTPQESGWVTGLTWSADSQRVAIATGNNSNEQVEIWDSTTGKHKITIPVSLDPIGNPAWSPASELLAVPTNNAVVILDGKTGKIVTRFPAPSSGTLSTTGTTSSVGNAPLTTTVPLGGAPNFGGIAWSPDGKWIVSTFSSATSPGVVQVWNPQTGKLAYTLVTKPDYFMGEVSWSPDGQYIAVHMARWSSSWQVDVWSVKTRQVIFEQTGNLEGLSWQPGTDNIASALIIPGSNSSSPGTATPTYGTAVLKLWNVTTKQLLKSFPGVDAVSWSPNGQEFAYGNLSGTSSQTASVTILNVNSGQKVYVYQASGPAAQTVNVVPAWSPDGKYIASAASIQPPSGSQQSYQVTVWVA
jgi:Tol biopolymer transport system component